ncbi:hypothetical protein ATANTOWER_006170 [Ataeniobius toweri]|uniref:Uncharacterized protein n=1 Tax=Ataeniobius toweri TaxID=208326 RepID=A0ABU7BN19_9TELE|nr:hypothetical protein [Ataeniobius toweri]
MSPWWSSLGSWARPGSVQKAEIKKTASSLGELRSRSSASSHLTPNILLLHYIHQPCSSSTFHPSWQISAQDPLSSLSTIRPLHMSKPSNSVCEVLISNPVEPIFVLSLLNHDL